MREGLVPIRVFVWSHGVMLDEDGSRIEQMVCRFDGRGERERAHVDKMVVSRAEGLGWRWAVFARPGLQGKVAAGEEVFLADALSACEEAFFMSRDYYQERFEREYLQEDACRVYGRF